MGLMPVALLPPITSGGGDWHGEVPITTARRYVRGRGNSRWHRIRSGVQWPEGRVSIAYWCGPVTHDGPGINRLWYRDELPVGEPACGTCVGRALGARQDEAPVGLPPLRFDPRWLEPPAKCPGSRSRSLWVSVGTGHSVGQCLACSEYVGIRAIGRGYNAWGAGPVMHAPGPGLVDPCPFHAWNRVVLREDRVICGCGWQGGADA